MTALSDGAMIGGRYRAEKTLKELMGVRTIRGVRSDTGERVVIKVAALSQISDGTRQRLEHEAEVGTGSGTPERAGRRGGVDGLTGPR